MGCPGKIDAIASGWMGNGLVRIDWVIRDPFCGWHGRFRYLLLYPPPSLDIVSCFRHNQAQPSAIARG